MSADEGYVEGDHLEDDDNGDQDDHLDDGGDDYDKVISAGEGADDCYLYQLADFK